MSGQDWLAGEFEQHRPHLRGVAYRMLGSLCEAEDAVQEAWIRLSRTDTEEVRNLGGWLTTVVARVCLDMLRTRKSRREELFGEQGPPPAHGDTERQIDPEEETVLADSVGLALLVVLERLAPAERLAFVLHDMFALPFDEIASILGRSSDSARQLASRARRRVRGGSVTANPDLRQQRTAVDAFLAAARDGNLEALLAVLHPDVVNRADRMIAPPNGREVHGASNVAKGAVAYSQMAQKGRAVPTMLALVDGSVGVLVAPGGRLVRVVKFEVRDGRIVTIDVIADPDRIRELDVALLED